MTRRNESPTVVLGMHSGNHLDVFVRTGDALTQAARIMTNNGTDPSAMTAVMADLATTFGWTEIAAGPLEVSQTQKGLPRAGAVALAAAPATEPDYHKRSRRKPAEMRAQQETLRKMLSIVPKGGAWPTGQVITALAAALKNKKLLTTGRSTVLASLQKLHDDKAIGRIEWERPNGLNAYSWYGK